MAEFNKIQELADYRGIDLNSPKDAPSGGKTATVLKNVRRLGNAYTQRQALNQLSAGLPGGVNVHSIRRLTDSAASTNKIFFGSGTALAYMNLDGTGVTSIDTGYSGNPLSLVPFRPEQDVNQWMAVGDTTKMVKVSSSGTLHNMGLPWPVNPPTCELNPLKRCYTIVDDFEDHTLWTLGAAYGGATKADSNRVSTTISTALQHEVGEGIVTGAPGAGWFTVLPTVGTAIGKGMMLSYDGGTGGNLTVHDVFHESQQTDIATVLDDADGIWSTIALSKPLDTLRQGALLLINGVYAIAYAVVTGANGEQCVRVKDTSFAIGDTVQVLHSFMAHNDDLTQAPSGNLTSVALEVANFVGQTEYTITRDTSGAPLDLTAYSGTGSVDRDVDLLNDEMHISVYMSDPDNFTEIKVMIDVDDETFDKNYYFRAIRPSDLTPVAEDRKTAIDNRVEEDRKARSDRERTARQDLAVELRDRSSRLGKSREYRQDLRDYVDPPGSTSSQTGSGRNQWSEIRFKLSELERVGTDMSKTLKTVNALRLLVKTKSSGTTQTVGFDSWTIYGGWGPDVGNFTPYDYRYRVRVPSTGARSNWSPASRMYVEPARHPVMVYLGPYTPASLTGSEATELVFDIQRRGGLVNDWRTIASVDYAVLTNTATFLDTLADEHAFAAGESLFGTEGNVNTQPFSVVGQPLTGINATVAGIMLEAGSGTPFSTSLAQGTSIIVNDVPTLVYRVHSTTLVELYENVGFSDGNARWEIPEPIYTSQNLPVFFGDPADWAFALGDTLNPGRLYFFNPGTLDSTQGRYWLDVTTGSEELMNGCVFNGRYYVWSTNHMYVLSPDPETVWRADPIPVPDGIYARYALAVGDSMYWLGRTGIYASDGSTSKAITDDLMPLFPRGNTSGATTNGVAPIATLSSLTTSQRNLFRLSCDQRYIYFIYTDDGSTRRYLTLDRSDPDGGNWGWMSDTYTTSATPSIFYPEEGAGVHRILVGGANAPTSTIFTVGGASAHLDAGQSFDCEVRSFQIGGEDARTLKLFGDGTVDAVTGNATITATFYFQSEATNVSQALTATAARSIPQIIDFVSGGGFASPNVALSLTWTASSTAPTVYGWGASFLGRPEQTIKRATDFSTAGYSGPKHVRGVFIHADTAGAAKTVLVEYVDESGTLANKSLAINHSYKTSKYYTFDSPFIAMVMRLRATDTNKWQLYPEETQWVYDQYPPLSNSPTPWDNGGTIGPKYLHGFLLNADTLGFTTTVQLQIDGDTPVQNFSVAHASGQTGKSYSLTNPVVCHNMRLVVISGNIRFFDVQWLWNPEAPLGDVWETQEFELGDPYGFCKEFEFEFASGNDLTLTYTIDGTSSYVTTVPTSGGTSFWVKRAVTLPSTKGRLAKLRLASASQFRLREKGSTVMIKSFGGANFSTTSVIGAMHGQGAPV